MNRNRLNNDDLRFKKSRGITKKSQELRWFRKIDRALRIIFRETWSTNPEANYPD